MYEVPDQVYDVHDDWVDGVGEIARRAVAAETQKQIDELTRMKAGYPNDSIGEKFIRAGLQSAIDHLRIRLAEVTAA